MGEVEHYIVTAEDGIADQVSLLWWPILAVDEELADILCLWLILVITVAKLEIMSIVRFLHWKDVFGVFLLAGVIYWSCCVEVEEDIKEFAIYFCANAISVTEAEIRIVNLLCLIAANANICRVSDILNDGLIEFTPHSVWDEKAGEHRIDDCQVRVFIIKRSAINICSIHHVFDSKSPTAIIY